MLRMTEWGRAQSDIALLAPLDRNVGNICNLLMIITNKKSKIYIFLLVKSQLSPLTKAEIELYKE